MKRVTLIPEAEDTGSRIDKFLADRLEGMTRSAVQKLIEDGLVSAGGKAVAKNYRLAGGEIAVELPDPVALDVAAEEIPLNIVYEDDWLLVVNKPQGMVVHPAAGNHRGTLVNALLAHCGESLSGINGVIRPGIVHRIDKDTSGLLLVAKNNAAHLSLSEQIKEHSLTRVYHTVVCGRLKEEEGTVDAPVGRHPVNRKKMAVVAKNGKNAVTHYKVLERFQGYTYAECRLETGRTHQIRVHMGHLGHPVLGDPLYGHGKCRFQLAGQCLHAKLIGFRHPADGRYLEFDSDLPDYFENILTKLRNRDKIEPFWNTIQ